MISRQTAKLLDDRCGLIGGKHTCTSLPLQISCGSLGAAEICLHACSRHDAHSLHTWPDMGVLPPLPVLLPLLLLM